MDEDKWKERLVWVAKRSLQEFSKIRGQSQKQLQLRALRKKQRKMYEKMGKEVELLIEQGEVQHPGLQRAHKHLQEINTELDAFVQKHHLSSVSEEDTDSPSENGSTTL